MDVDNSADDLKENKHQNEGATVGGKLSGGSDVGEQSLVPFGVCNTGRGGITPQGPFNSVFCDKTECAPRCGFTIVSEELGFSLKAMKRSKTMPKDHVEEGCCFCDVCMER